jgi:hypothetical protein
VVKWPTLPVTSCNVSDQSFFPAASRMVLSFSVFARRRSASSSIADMAASCVCSKRRRLASTGRRLSSGDDVLSVILIKIVRVAAGASLIDESTATRFYPRSGWWSLSRPASSLPRPCQSSGLPELVECRPPPPSLLFVDAWRSFGRPCVDEFVERRQPPGRPHEVTAGRCMRKLVITMIGELSRDIGDNDDLVH